VPHNCHLGMRMNAHYLRMNVYSHVRRYTMDGMRGSFWGNESLAHADGLQTLALFDALAARGVNHAPDSLTGPVLPDRLTEIVRLMVTIPAIPRARLRFDPDSRVFHALHLKRDTSDLGTPVQKARLSS